MEPRAARLLVRLVLLILLQIGLASGVVTSASGTVVISSGEWRSMKVRAVADGQVDDREVVPPQSGQSMWNETADAMVDGILGDAEAHSVIGSFASTDTLIGNGQATGSLTGVGSSFSATSHTEFEFTIPPFDCHGFGVFASVGSAGGDNVGSASFDFVAVEPDTGTGELTGVVIGGKTVNGGDPEEFVIDNGQLSEGTYRVLSDSSGSASGSGGYAAPDYTWIFSFTPCLNPLLEQQPHGSEILAGATATLSVGVASAALAASGGTGPDGIGSFTYQWRHGSQDLVDDGRITGATTDTLTITDFGAEDAGGYNVWVSDGSSRQLSTLAVLALPEPDAAASLAAGLTLLLALHRHRLRREGWGGPRRTGYSA